MARQNEARRQKEEALRKANAKKRTSQLGGAGALAIEEAKPKQKGRIPSFQKEVDFDFKEVTELEEINIIYKVPATTFGYTQEEVDRMAVKPRTLKAARLRDRRREPWVFGRSAFRHYKPESQKLLDQCFETDWEHIVRNLEAFIKDCDDRDGLKGVLK